MQKQFPEVLSKKMFLKISQNIQENACSRGSFSIKRAFLFFDLIFYQDLHNLRNFQKNNLISADQTPNSVLPLEFK